MRDWYLVFLPVVIVVYFGIFPDQFIELVDWAAQWFR
jgi:hypothetical protein